MARGEGGTNKLDCTFTQKAAESIGPENEMSKLCKLETPGQWLSGFFLVVIPNQLFFKVNLHLQFAVLQAWLFLDQGNAYFLYTLLCVHLRWNDLKCAVDI